MGLLISFAIEFTEILEKELKALWGLPRHDF
jgi:hypothetical protein